MAAHVCKCSHDKRDHQVIAGSGRGPCCHCLCDMFVSSTPKAVKPKLVPEDVVATAPVRRDWILR